MDLELLRTFIEVCRCRHFGKAADRLYITQSAVSARIRQLETSLGCQLLIRERKQVQPTADGERFLQHAENLLKQWERARRDMTDSAAGGPPLRVGALSALWEVRGLDWLREYRLTSPDVRLHIESHDATVLMPRLLEGSLDLVLQFGAPRSADVECRLIGTTRLVLAATRPQPDFSSALQQGYIAMEWGSVFASAQAEFAPAATAGLRMDSLHAVLGWLKNNDGSAYLPEDSVRRDDRLHTIDDAPVFEREMYALWLARNERRDMIDGFLAVTAGR
jgi:DNA-binding transcriptional LysR family regulator